MKKIFIIIVASFILSKASSNEAYEKAYFAGGCFWCVEEYFDKVEGVVKTISGYSGGHTRNPTYEQVVKNQTGHVEVVEVTYDVTKVNYSELVKVHLNNIDPFDNGGQFCDRGESYKAVIFFKNNKERTIIEKSLNNIEKRFKRKTYVQTKKFSMFYGGEEYHQDYYQRNFINYLIYKANCGREKKLETIWKQ